MSLEQPSIGTVSTGFACLIFGLLGLATVVASADKDELSIGDTEPVTTSQIPAANESLDPAPDRPKGSLEDLADRESASASDQSSFESLDTSSNGDKDPVDQAAVGDGESGLSQDGGAETTELPSSGSGSDDELLTTATSETQVSTAVRLVYRNELPDSTVVRLWIEPRAKLPFDLGEIMVPTTGLIINGTVGPDLSDVRNLEVGEDGGIFLQVRDLTCWIPRRSGTIVIRLSPAFPGDLATIEFEFDGESEVAAIDKTVDESVSRTVRCLREDLE